MGWKCHAFTGCMGRPATFKDFNKSYKRENFCNKLIIIIIIYTWLYTIKRLLNFVINVEKNKLN